MFTHLPPGQYKIVSSGDDRPVGVDYMVPPLPFQFLRLGLPCQTWQVDRAFVLCGYRYTGVNDDKVIVSANPDDNVKWKMVPYMENTYIISPVDDPASAWTVSPEFSINPHIVISKISTHGPGSDQLFRVVAVDE